MHQIVIIFQAKQQETEALALAFGLGAVQAGANIRLRHLHPDPAIKLAHAGYGTLSKNDLDWAEGVALFSDGDLAPTSEDSGLLWRVDGNPDPTRGSKQAFLYSSEGGEGLLSLRDVIQQLGLSLWRLAEGTVDSSSMSALGSAFAALAPAAEPALENKGERQ